MRKKQQIHVMAPSRLDQVTALSIFALQQRLVQELDDHEEKPTTLKVHVYSNGKAAGEAVEETAAVMGGN